MMPANHNCSGRLLYLNGCLQTSGGFDSREMGTYLLHRTHHGNILDINKSVANCPFQLGGVTCVWAFIVWFLLPDSPSNAWFLKQRERLVAVKRVSGNETGIKNKSFDKKQAVVAFQDPKAILLFISVFAA